MSNLLDLIGPLTLLDFFMVFFAVLSIGCVIMFSSHHVWSDDRDIILNVQCALCIPLLILYWGPYVRYIPFEYPEWFMELTSTNMVVDTAAMIVWVICTTIMLILDRRHHSKDSKAGIHRTPKERNEKTEYQKVADGYNR